MEKKSFHLGHTPKQELALKKEIDDIAWQTIQEIASTKAAEMNKPLDDVERLKWSLEPNFVPERRYEHRRTHPIFHDNEKVRPISPKAPASKQANIPAYNPLDKQRGRSPTRTEVTKKYPYTKSQKVTTSEMRQPKKSAVGVLPNSRHTTEIQELNVLVEGRQPLAQANDSPEGVMISAVKDANLSIPVYEGCIPGFPTPQTVRESTTQAPKPAILKQTGTTGGVSLTQRPQPPAKPASINLEKARKKAAILRRKQRELTAAQSQATCEVVLLGEDDDEEEEDDERSLSEVSDGSIRSVRELVEEAQRIAAGSHVSLQKVSPSPRQKVSKSKRSKYHVVQHQPEKTVRTVDEIISSLKTQKSDGDVETEADRKIKEIMQRVMKHATTVLADIDQVEQEDDEEEKMIDESSIVENNQMEASGDQSVEKPSSAAPTPYTDILSPSAPNEEELSTEVVKQPSTAESDKNVHVESEQTSQEKTTPDLYDLKQAYSDIVLQAQVKHEDIVSVHGKVKTFVSKLLDDGRTKKEITQHLANVHDSVQSYISRYTKAKSFGAEPPQPRVPDYTRHVHYFCTAKHGIQMPKDLASAVRLYHTPDMMKQALKGSWVFNQQFNSHNDEQTFQVNEVSDAENTAIERKRSAAARTILDEAKAAGGLSLSTWKEKAQDLLKDEQSSLTVSGTKADILQDESRVFWSCAPPKMSMNPSHVREHLFPTYYGAELPAEETLEDIAAQDLDDETDEGEQNVLYSGDPEDRAAHQRVILRKHHSCQDLTHLLKSLMIAKEKKDSDFQLPGTQDSQVIGGEISKEMTPHTDGGKVSSTPRVTPISRLSMQGYGIQQDKQAIPSVVDSTALPLTDEQIFPAILPKRCDSAPGLIELRDDFIAIPEDFSSAMAELDRQRCQIDQMKRNAMRERVEDVQVIGDEPEVALEREKEQTFYATLEELEHKRREIIVAKPTLAEQALAAGRNYVIVKKEKKLSKAGKVDLSRVEDIERFLYSMPRKIEKSESLLEMNKGLPERSLRVPQHVRDKRRGSLPDLPHWQEFVEKQPQQLADVINEREWVRDIWNDWFDEVFPPEEETLTEREGTDLIASRPQTKGDYEDVANDEPIVSQAVQDKVSVITDDEFLKIESLEPLDDESEDEAMLREALQEEVIRVKERIDKTERPLPFDYCRLGAIERKLGQLKNAREHLDLAIKLEPLLLHAYWQRHLWFLLQGKRSEALEDLNYILKLNRNHVGAYVSRAQLIGASDYTMAITNLTQAIKLQPTNADIYIKRAELYEKRDQILLAMEDYAKAYKLDGSLTIAVFRRASFYFKQKNWTAAVNDFSEFLRKCPFDAKARLLRGRAFTKLSMWRKAVQDLSAAIHHEPNNWEAYYYRACVFRKAMPRQALMDYSMSILINDSEDNIKSLLHRGVLYDAMGRPEDAIPDFEAILKLRKDVAVAHLNLGLIYLTKMESFQKAIRKFTAAIKCDPTYVRAYVCRAEAYTKIHDHKNATLDYTRAIHLRPEVPDFYMRRGYMLLKSGKTSLASYCVRHVSELFADSDLGQSATQQAVVHSFLKNYSKAIMALDNAIKIGPNPPLYILLGKTQMKAKLWQDAIDSFSHALDLQKPWKPKDKWPKESAEVNFLIGLCSLELRNYLKAHDAFNQALVINKNYAEAYYQRGVAKLRLKQVKGIQDINRALALDRKIFQAYLTRAAYYGMKGRYSKAILNCNEAIKLKPNSVRAHLYRGALKCHGKAYELAVRDLTQAIKIDNQCALAFFNRAVCYHDSGQYQKALTDYGIVLLLGDQLLLKVLINRGILYLSHDDYKNALHDFLLAARVNDSDPKIRHSLGLCMHKLRQLKEAVAIFTEAISMDKFFLEAYVSRGNVFLDYGNEEGIKAAQCDYERALMFNPTYLPARVNLAYSLQMSGKFNQAWTQFTTVIGQDPTCQPAYEGRAIVNLQMSNLFAALQDVNASVKLKDSAELYTNRGVINIFMKDLVGAMSNFQAAIKNDPTYALAYFNAANIYFKNRQFRQAKAYYDRAIGLNDKDESAYVNRAITNVMIKDVPAAMNDFSKAIKLSPKSAHIYFNRGNLYASQEDWKLAEADYTKALTLQPDDPVTHKRRADIRGKMGLRDKAVSDYQYAVQLQARIKLLKSIHTK